MRITEVRSCSRCWSLIVGVALSAVFISNAPSQTVSQRRAAASSSQPRSRVAKQTAGPVQRRTAGAPRPRTAVGTQPAGTAGAARGNRSGSSEYVAVVNGEPISRSELARECLRRFGEDVLETVINRHLILQACKQKGIQITSQDVDQEIQRLSTNLGLTPDRFLQVINDERNITPEQYRNDITWPMIALRRLAADRTTVSRDELRQAFASQYGPKVQVRMISVSTRKKADQLLQQALADPDAFGDLAKNNSEDVNSAAGRGLIPPIRRHTGEQEVEAAVFGLKEGEISQVISAGGQFFLFKCERHIPATTIEKSEQKVVVEHLTNQIREEKLRVAGTDMLEELQSTAKVVNVFNTPELRESTPGAAAMVNGQPISLRYVADQCIARHGLEVLDGEINRKLLTQSLRKHKLQVTQADLQQEIDRAAEAFGFVTSDKTADRDAWLKHITNEQGTTYNLYVLDAVWPSVALKKLVQHEVQVTDEDIHKGFVSNYGPRVRVLACVLSNRTTANKVWSMAKNNPTDRFFGELAHEYSIEPVSRNNFGQVPPIRRHGGQPLLENEAFSLGPKNELSGVLAMGDKYIILRYLGSTKPVITELQDVRDELVKDLHEKKMRLAMTKAFDALKENAQVENRLAGSSASMGRASQASHQTPVPGTAQRRKSDRAPAVRKRG